MYMIHNNRQSHAQGGNTHQSRSLFNRFWIVSGNVRSSMHTFHRLIARLHIELGQCAKNFILQFLNGNLDSWR